MSEFACSGTVLLIDGKLEHMNDVTALCTIHLGHGGSLRKTGDIGALARQYSEAIFSAHGRYEEVAPVPASCLRTAKIESHNDAFSDLRFVRTECFSAS